MWGTQKKRPGDYETNPQAGRYARAAGKGAGMGVGVPQRGGASIPALPPRTGFGLGPKPSQHFRPEAAAPQRPPQPQAVTPQGWTPRQVATPPPGGMPELKKPGAEQAKEWFTGGGMGGEEADEAGTNIGSDVLEALAQGEDWGEHGPTATEESLAKLFDEGPPQLSQDYEDALVAQYQAEQAAKLKQLYEQAGATGTGASGAFGGPLEGLLTAGTTGLMGLKADIEFKNKEMQQDWAKMKTAAFVEKWGKELDAQTKAALALNQTALDQQKIDLQEEAQEAEIQQQLGDSLASTWANALSQYTMNWKEENKGKAQMAMGEVLEQFDAGTLTYGAALGLIDKIMGALAIIEKGMSPPGYTPEMSVEEYLQSLIQEASTAAPEFGDWGEEE